ncbi:MAG: hypothetical protein LUC47_09710 [Clostridiales bacterium]|nr:hypothetical protein [Clostridiales bacterium]
MTDRDYMRRAIELAKRGTGWTNPNPLVAEVTERDFQVSIIPHTGAETTLLGKKPEDVVNLETDIVGKYVEKLLNRQTATSPVESTLTMEFLKEYGF